MKVLWFADGQLPAVTGLPKTGGGWIEGLRLALALHEPDVELAIASPGRVRHEPFTAGNATYFHIGHAPSGGRVESTLRRWRHEAAPASGIASCEAIARAWAPDVVHVHGAEHYFGLALFRLDAPGVVSLQGLATVYARFTLSALRPADIVREVGTRDFFRGYGPLHAHWRMQARGVVERQVFAACDDFMGRTAWDRAVLTMLRPDARYHEVGEVLGEPFYGTEWTGPAGDGESLFCTAGTSTLKGVERLLEALILLRRSGLRSPRLRIAGSVAGGLLGRRIASLLVAPELSGAVDLLGQQSPAEIAKELAGASAFVLPSHIENSPNALCEAMLVGTPCIAAFVGGVPSLVRHGEEGLLYHDADPFALAGAVDRLLGDRELGRRLGSAARESALRRHDPERVAGQAAGVYREMLSRPGTSRAGVPTSAKEVAP